MLKFILNTAIFLVAFSTYAMEMKRNQMTINHVTKEFLLSIEEKRAFSHEILKEWRKDYEDCLNAEPTKSQIREFLETYAYAISEAFQKNYPTTKELKQATKNISYDIVYKEFINEFKLKETFLENITISAGSNNQNNVITIGRSVNADINHKEFPQDISRVHLVVIPLHDGRALIFDPFSLFGSEQVNLDEFTRTKADRAFNSRKRLNNPIVASQNQILHIRIGMGVISFIPQGDISTENIEQKIAQDFYDFIHCNKSVGGQNLAQWLVLYNKFIINEKDYTKEHLKDFLRPYSKAISLALNHNEPVVDKVYYYDLIFYRFDQNTNNLIQFHQDSFSMSVEPHNETAFTIGRSFLNDNKAPDNLETDISGVHLIIIPLANEKFLIFDPFSPFGSEIVDLNKLTHNKIIEIEKCGNLNRYNNPMIVSVNEAFSIRIGKSIATFIPRSPDREEEETRTCSFCLEKFPDIKLSCGHSCVCNECCTKIKKCPLCEKEIISACYGYSNRTFDSK